MHAVLPAKTPEMFLVCLVKSLGTLKGTQKFKWQRLTLAKRVSHVPISSQHELQLVDDKAKSTCVACGSYSSMYFECVLYRIPWSP
eukprot:6188605-Pleurochrysis_carterae.AAC.2